MSSTDERWHHAVIPLNSTIQQAIRNLDRVALKIAMVTNEHDVLLGTICDGDIRRGLLKGLSLESPIDGVIHRGPFVVPPNLGRETVLQLMVANKIQQIPVVDANQKIVGLHLWDEINLPCARSNPLIIMAGGKGTRLAPHTLNCPKPLVHVAGKPMIEHIIERGKLDGFSHFVVAVNYLADMIEEHLGVGDRFNVKIDYLRERSPLGTAGALSLLSPRPKSPLLVTNGDVISDIRFGEMLDFHVRHEATATMAVRLYEWQHPFGVVQTEGIEIIGFEEKPIARSHINAGVYALSPEALDELVAESPCDMPTLFERLNARFKRTVAYPVHEPWLDVGRPDDLSKANKRKISDA